jgi:hypothetical protein
MYHGTREIIYMLWDLSGKANWRPTKSELAYSGSVVDVVSRREMFLIDKR